MRCPICGANMKGKISCQYCKITGEQVVDASNLEAKKALKQGDKSKVVMSTILPKDVNNMRLLLIAIFLGWCGGNSYYVGRRWRGLFQSLSWLMFIIFFAIDEGYFMNQSPIVFKFFYEVFVFCVVACMLLWFVDIISVALKRFKMPVVLAEVKTEQPINKTKSGKK